MDPPPNFDAVGALAVSGAAGEELALGGPLVALVELAAAAAHKRNQALDRAGAALRKLDEQGRPITFQAVARQANVSRQWLYQQPELRTEIERLRAIQLERPGEIPTRERASEASLRQRLQTLSDENQRLRDQIAGLTAELAIAYGQRRAGP